MAAGTVSATFTDAELDQGLELLADAVRSVC